MKSAQGVLFVTPEYNRSIPGVLKNAIDHGSRPYGQSVWSGKPAGVIGTSPGAIGSALAQPEAFVQAKDGLFDAAGNISSESRQFLQNWVDRYAAWVVKHAA